MNKDERKELTGKIEGLKERLTFHKERWARRDELTASCDREVKDCNHRLALAEARRTQMLADLVATPGQIATLENELEVLRSQVNLLNHSEQIDKAKDLAEQILKLRSLGFTITPPQFAAQIQEEAS